MSTVDMEVDKVLPVSTTESYGEINIRVVVLNRTAASVAAVISEEEADDDELGIFDRGDEDKVKNPVDSFLESPGKRGALSCVFLINGQRQHAWDNTFISRDLGFKYLRNRMLIVVDVDGLRPESIAQLMQGSRHQFYEGEVYAALQRRLIDALKGDPELIQLEDEAEQEVMSLKTGDDVVRKALDDLIDAHHDAGDHSVHGNLQAGRDSRHDHLAGELKQTSHTVVEDIDEELAASEPPVLVIVPETVTVRLHPDEKKTVRFAPKPANFMTQLESFAVSVDSPVNGLRIAQETLNDSVSVELTFSETDDSDDDEYPIETSLRAIAKFKGMEDSRTCERRVIISARKGGPNRKPREPKPLLDVPTFLKVTSRSPIRMTVGGPDVHVKLRWDGKDELVEGLNPQWKFRANVLDSNYSFLPSFVNPRNGRFQLLLRVPSDLTPGETLRINVEAVGPNNAVLSATCEIASVESPRPRRKSVTDSGGAQRKPPYILKIVERSGWHSQTCWSGREWTADDPAAFQAPTQNQPLVLLINDDASMLLEARNRMLAKKLAESTIEQRNRKYQSHVAYHLWQMYLSSKKAQDAPPDENVKGPQEEDFRMEIRRVSGTLLQLMGVV